MCQCLAVCMSSNHIKQNYTGKQMGDLRHGLWMSEAITVFTNSRLK